MRTVGRWVGTRQRAFESMTQSTRHSPDALDGTGMAPRQTPSVSVPEARGVTIDRIGGIGRGLGTETGRSTTRVGVGGNGSAEVCRNATSTVSGAVLTPETVICCGVRVSEVTCGSDGVAVATDTTAGEAA